MITVLQLANHILGREAITGDDFYEAGLPMMGGCGPCGASIACYNSHPSKTGYLLCEDCVGDKGFETVEEAKAFVFPGGSAEYIGGGWPIENDEDISDLIAQVGSHIHKDYDEGNLPYAVAEAALQALDSSEGIVNTMPIIPEPGEEATQ
jgi:hypothetical protein